MNKSHQYNQQTEPNQYKSEVEEMCIYQNLESGCHSICFWKKYFVSSMLERIPLKQQNLKIVACSDTSFSKKRIYIYNDAA